VCSSIVIIRNTGKKCKRFGRKRKFLGFFGAGSKLPKSPAARSLLLPSGLKQKNFVFLQLLAYFIVYTDEGHFERRVL
jgi:hypothetical protein